jgi:lipopolysaccharide transport system ATP-binding protein
MGRMNNCALRIDSLGKQYRLGEIGTGTLSNDLNRWIARILGRPDPYQVLDTQHIRQKKETNERVWAIRDISFEVEQGEVLGVIGKNGAGKSTLLKLLSRVTAPTEGTIRGYGRVASLLHNYGNA